MLTPAAPSGGDDRGQRWNPPRSQQRDPARQDLMRTRLSWPARPWTSGSPPRICPWRRTGSLVDRDGRISLRYTPTNVEAHERLIAKFKGLRT
jgi:hypothetical protein